MKKILLYIILLSYTVVIFRPVLPYVSDFVGHVFFYAHHMATMHYENGKYHVHYELAKYGKEEQSDKSTLPTLKKDNLSNEHIISVFITPSLSHTLVITKYKLQTTPAVVSGSVKNNYPPPKA